MVDLRYINRPNRKISHVYGGENADFNEPLCGTALIWRSNAVRGSSSVTAGPAYALCKRCMKMLETAKAARLQKLRTALNRVKQRVTEEAVDDG